MKIENPKLDEYLAEMRKLDKLIEKLAYDYNLEEITATRTTSPRGALQITAQYRRVKHGGNTFKDINKTFQAICTEHGLMGQASDIAIDADDKPMDKLINILVYKL